MVSLQPPARREATSLTLHSQQYNSPKSLSHLWRYKRTLGFARTASDSKLFAFIKEDLPAIFKTAALQVTGTAFEECFCRRVSDELFICSCFLTHSRTFKMLLKQSPSCKIFQKCQHPSALKPHFYGRTSSD